MHATLTPTTRRVPISLWISAVLFVVYSALGVAVALAVRTDALNILALLTVSPLMFVGMVVSVVDIVRTRKRGDADPPYTRLQWVGLALMVAAMPLWMAIAIAIASLP
ncbi:hypothetical protein SAMN05216368_10717 [Cryobacterium flavum]|uniref:Uncharacterized protein n=1 Tax=Cryobacterium flavum TaxID=1424659 RepID=A0A4R8V289_9MICO|nr:MULTISPECIES: hypothetical protein [Cryobacterium]TFB75518.1 hypothetical protein E3O21_11835 [Cryobacterium flavum]SDN72581.1 hypothetical protein SAMN05216368_10717 [Cryobacterium flavum]